MACGICENQTMGGIRLVVKTAGRGAHRPRLCDVCVERSQGCGMGASQRRRAVTTGLALRPLPDTLTATLQREIAREDAGPYGAGLTDGDER